VGEIEGVVVAWLVVDVVGGEVGVLRVVDELEVVDDITVADELLVLEEVGVAAGVEL
jgi:hypothetical protein